ncbi:hypothetical protein HU675_0016185 [Bradyrhizobium septentrionale]|uniref:hypothetical protein n=1 Tax=Bradyrhizobium septentrionale TaxID=1404411 RepID=UPI0015970B95|nr:hypothetical protein [Bradyrhizobium septentrionale]UGY28168.1 hypothetical protein HU675_0016185 [Bradyrhizobium septentrionale]
MADQPRRFSMEANTTGLTPGPVIEAIAPMLLSVGMSLQPQFDVIKLLPENRKEFLRLLRDRRSEKYAANILFETIRAGSERVTAAASEVKRLTDSRLHVKLDDRQVIAAQSALTEAKDDLERTKQRSEKLAAAAHAVGISLMNVESWLRHGRPPGTVLEAVEVEPPKLLKGESLLDGADRFERRSRELRADIHRVRSAPYPSAHVKRKIREQVAQLEPRAPDVTLMIEGDGDLIWPFTHVRAEVFGEQRALAFHDAIDVVGLLAFFLTPEIMIKRLDALIDAESDDKAALSHDQRQRAEAELLSDLLSTERDICSLIRRGQAEGLPMEFPADIDPRALLSVRCVVAPRADLPPTSPEHAYNIVGGRR